jgi:hypothetical protein
MGNVVFRPFRPGDEIAINERFNRVFGLARSLSEWHWKYPAEPEGRWMMIGCDEEGALLSHYGAVPVRLQDGSLEVRAGQIGDVFTVREARHGLAAARTYIGTVRAFFADYGAPDKLAVLYGFPGERALRLGLAKLGYDQMPPQPVPVWRRAAAHRGNLFTGHRVRLGFDAAAANELWKRAKGRYPVSAVRDAAWLARRFLGRPSVEYLHLTARRRERAVALAIVRVTGEVAQWAELVWDGVDPHALVALDRAVGQVARRAGAERVEMWLDGDGVAEEVLARLGWDRGAHPAGLVMVARSFHPDIVVATFADRFYLTMSDADLV